MSTKSSEAAPQTIEPVGCASLRTVRELEVRRLGIVPYAEALALQRALVEERRANRVPDLLILLQHPPVITVGVRGDGGRSHIIADTDRLAALGVAVSETGRKVREYRITAGGRKQLEAEMAEYRRMADAIGAVLDTA